MKLIIGLGNPEKKFKMNRHNIGFNIIDSFAYNRKFTKSYIDLPKFRKLNLYSKMVDSKVVLLYKPIDWMNNSGNSISKLVDFLNVNKKNIMVIHDDIDFNFGTVRVKFGGGTGGHNGLKSIINEIGDDFCRLRIGIGPKDENISLYNYVLSDFGVKETKHFCDLYNLCDIALYQFIEFGINKTMNLINRRSKY